MFFHPSIFAASIPAITPATGTCTWHSGDAMRLAPLFANFSATAAGISTGPLSVEICASRPWKLCNWPWRRQPPTSNQQQTCINLTKLTGQTKTSLGNLIFGSERLQVSHLYLWCKKVEDNASTKWFKPPKWDPVQQWKWNISIFVNLKSTLSVAEHESQHRDKGPSSTLARHMIYIYIITVIDIITYVQILRVSQNQVLYQNYGTVSVKPDFTKDHWCFGPSWDTKQNATYVTQLNEEARLSLSNLKPCLWCGWARSSLKRGVSHVLIPWNPPSHKSFQWLLQFHSMHANHGTSQPGLLLITTTAIIMKKHHGRNTV